MGDGQANLTKGALLKPIEKLTGSDFFPERNRGERASFAWPFYLTPHVQRISSLVRAAVYQKGPLNRCLRDVMTMNQHVIGTPRTYEMAGRLLLGLEPLRWLF